MYNILIIENDKIVAVTQSKNLDKFKNKEFMLVEKLQATYLDESFQLHKDCVNKDGSIMPLSEQVAKGYFDIELVYGDEFKLEGENVVKKSQEELKKEFPDRYPSQTTDEPSELELIIMEISSLEYEVGLELIREMARKYLLEDSNLKDATQKEKYKQLLQKKEELEQVSSMKGNKKK